MRRWVIPVVAGALALCAAPAHAAEPLDAASFADPPASTHPAMRWWWGPMFGGTPGALSTAETRKELGYLADAGFKRVEIAFSQAKWATAEQRENLDAALAEAKQRGVTIDMTVGASWPVKTAEHGAGHGPLRAGAAVRPRRCRGRHHVQRRRAAAVRHQEQRAQREAVRG